jgi:ATP-dependent DNA helicase PIF1
LQCNQVLRLKKGAAVMCTFNLDMENSICNGSQGIVIDIIDTCTPPLPVVRFSNGITRTIQPKYWQSEEYPKIAIGQYPLCLAWALTIHKIQGATLTMAEMDIGQSIFEYGQTYVALSRIKSLDGLYLSDFQSERIAANPKVVAFYNTIPRLDKSSIDTLKSDDTQIPSKNTKIIKL